MVIWGIIHKITYNIAVKNLKISITMKIQNITMKMVSNQVFLGGN